MIPYKTFMRHAKKVTETAPETRPALKGVFHKSDGSAVVTDGKRLYIIKNLHNFLNDSIISPNGDVINGDKYPDVSRIIPSDWKQEVVANVQELIEALDSIYSPASIIDEKVIIKFDGYAIHSFLPNHYKAKFNIPFTFEEKTFFNAKFWLDALKLFKDAGCVEVTIKFNGRMRPLTLESKDGSVTALIMPVRTW